MHACAGEVLALFAVHAHACMTMRNKCVVHCGTLLYLCLALQLTCGNAQKPDACTDIFQNGSGARGLPVAV